MIFLPDETSVNRPVGDKARSAHVVHLPASQQRIAPAPRQRLTCAASRPVRPCPQSIPKALLDVLPRVPFLVAKRDIAPGEEVLWHYQVALDKYEPN